MDPQSDLKALLSDAEARGFRLTGVLLTHTHHDHVAGLPGLAVSHPGLPVVVHASDAHRLSSHLREKFEIRHAHDGDVLELGKLRIQVIHTPGHSAGECCYLVESPDSTQPYLLTGDTVFIRDCGRTDLESGSVAEMYASLQRLKTLPPASIILPGHQYKPEVASTLEKEMRESPPFLCQSVEELAALP